MKRILILTTAILAFALNGHTDDLVDEVSRMRSTLSDIESQLRWAENERSREEMLRKTNEFNAYINAIHEDTARRIALRKTESEASIARIPEPNGRVVLIMPPQPRRTIMYKGFTWEGAQTYVLFKELGR